MIIIVVILLLRRETQGQTLGPTGHHRRRNRALAGRALVDGGAPEVVVYPGDGHTVERAWDLMMVVVHRAGRRWTARIVRVGPGERDSDELLMTRLLLWAREASRAAEPCSGVVKEEHVGGWWLGWMIIIVCF